MKHLHKKSGLMFECGELMETSVEVVDGVRRTYDMTVITFWGKHAEESDKPPIIVGYYFGDYTVEDTDYYIDRWLQTVRDCLSIVDAYWLTNEDVLIDDEFDETRSRVQRTLTILNETVEAFDSDEVSCE